jgi:Family of unknown function (DUF5677)
MSDIAASFGFREEWADFGKRNPGFLRVMPALGESIQRVFGRKETFGARSATVVQDRLIYHLASVCAEDFLEILLLCGNGYGIGGMKLLRGLYERTVTVGYLINNPEEIGTFLEHGHIHRGRHLNHARKLVRMDERIPADHLREIDEAYKTARPKFREPLCEKCGTTKDMASWTKLSTDALALRANPPGTKRGLEALYLPCFFEPTMQLHATIYSVTERVEVSEDRVEFLSGPQRDRADHAIRSAHALILALMEMQNRHFGLGMDTEIQARNWDHKEAWDPPGSSEVQ